MNSRHKYINAAELASRSIDPSSLIFSIASVPAACPDDVHV